MRSVRESKAPHVKPDVELEQGCILCGGSLSLRVVGNSATTYCRICRWISRPHLQQDDGGMRLFHPSRLIA